MTFRISVAHSDVLELLDAVETVLPLDKLTPREHCRLEDAVALSADRFQWTLANGTGILSRSDNAFLLAFVRCGGRLSQNNQDRLSELHRRVGGRDLPAWLPWERNPHPRRPWR